MLDQVPVIGKDSMCLNVTLAIVETLMSDRDTVNSRDYICQTRTLPIVENMYARQE